MESYSTKIIELDKHDKDFAGFKWALKAVDFDLGYTLSRIISINLDGIVATDGHRLHIYKAEESYPIGIFKILLRQQYHLILAHTKDVRFPQYKDVIPDYTKFKEFGMSGNIDLSYPTIIRNMDTDGLSYTYLDDVGSMDKVYIGAKGQPIIFEGFNKLAMIMPMRI